MAGKFIVGTILILIIGFGFYGYQLYTAMEQIKVTKASLASFDLQGFPIPSKILLQVDLYVRNPTSASIELDKLSYRVYINDKFAAEGTKYSILIPANSITPLRIPVEITTSDILNLIASLVKEDKKNINLDIKGVMDVPIKLFGGI
ncbi:MAG: LEA type 2 family protein, partial [Candidatus Methanomethyliales bacterium]|nr:LEA type 2 family protein [Candidatus Methanomethylicales archaeon]